VIVTAIDFVVSASTALPLYSTTLFIIVIFFALLLVFVSATSLHTSKIQTDVEARRNGSVSRRVFLDFEESMNCSDRIGIPYLADSFCM